MRLEIIQSLQIIIIALLSYIPTVAISGWFEAWVAKKCGDDVPEQFGFLTLDPMVHFNVVGFAFLLIGKLLGDYLPFFRGIPGWGRYMPLTPSESAGWKVALEFNARAIAHLVMAFASLIGIVYCMKHGYMGYDWSIAQQASSVMSSLIYVLQFFYSQNIMLCIIYFAIGTFRTVMVYYFPDFYLFSTQHIIWGMLILFGAVIVCAEAYRFIVSKLMASLVYIMVV
jgi:hypothetical protein